MLITGTRTLKSALEDKARRFPDQLFLIFEDARWTWREFDADVMSLDYRVRGFTRDFKGRKFFIDHRITSIQNFIDPDILADYQAVDVNVYQESMFHTKMMWKKVDLDRYLFGGKAAKNPKFVRVPS